MTLEAVRAAHVKLSEWYLAQPKSSPLPLGLTNWTYKGDAHVEAVDPNPVVFVGFNPGGGNGAVVPGMSPSERTWRTRCERLARTKANRIVFAELISLPTRNQGGLQANDACLEEMMQASVASNLAIIAFHQPKVVFQTGITGGHLRLVERLYGLTLETTTLRAAPRREQVLARTYRLDGGVPWIAFRHFASRGFSEADRAGVQAEAERVGWRGDASWSQ